MLDGESVSEAVGLDLIRLLVDFVGGKNEKLNNGEWDGKDEKESKLASDQELVEWCGGGGGWWCHCNVGQ